MEITGQLKVKFDIQKVSDKFQKREFVLTTEQNTPYPQHIAMQMTQDKVGILDQFNPGDELRVQFSLRGREWNGPQGIKYFNTIEAWRVELIQKGSGEFQTDSQKTTPTTKNETNTFTANTGEHDSSDLPF